MKYTVHSYTHRDSREGWPQLTAETSGIQRDVVYLGSPLYISPKNSGEGGVAGSRPMSAAVHRSPNKLWRSNSIFNLRLKLRQMGTHGVHMEGVLPRLVCLAYRACTTDFVLFLAALVGPGQNIFPLPYTISLNLSPSFSKLQAGQAVVLRRLSLNMCLWLYSTLHPFTLDFYSTKVQRPYLRSGHGG
jgi:hypothetical protein